MKRGLLVVSGLVVLAVIVVGGILLAIFPGVRVALRAYLGDTKAMMKMGAVTQDLTWDKKACNAGNPDACWGVWNMKRTADETEALEYLKKGAILELKQRKGFSCLLELSRVHEYGLLGQPRNQHEADRLSNQYEGIKRELRTKGMIL